MDPIRNFWDGSKVRVNQDFWNPAKEWELLVVCPQCKTCHKAFPRKCEELLDPRNWDENLESYKFCCSKCRHSIVSPKKLDPGTIFISIPILLHLLFACCLLGCTYFNSHTFTLIICH